MSTGRSLLAAKDLNHAAAGRHIALRYNATITGRLYMDQATLERCASNLLDVAVSHYAARKWDAGLWLVSVSASLESTSRSMFDASYLQANLRTLVTVKSLDPFPSYNRTPAKRSILVLPNQIALRGSIAIISLTLGLTYSGWNSFSGENWQRLQRKHTPRRSTDELLSLASETHGDLLMLCGSQE